MFRMLCITIHGLCSVKRKLLSWVNTTLLHVRRDKVVLAKYFPVWRKEIFSARQWSCGKVVLSVMCVCLSFCHKGTRLPHFPHGTPWTCTNMFNLDLIIQGPAPGHVQLEPYHTGTPPRTAWRAGSWHLTEIPSCFHLLQQIITQDCLWNFKAYVAENLWWWSFLFKLAYNVWSIYHSVLTWHKKNAFDFLEKILDLNLRSLQFFYLFPVNNIYISEGNLITPSIFLQRSLRSEQLLCRHSSRQLMQHKSKHPLINCQNNSHQLMTYKGKHSLINCQIKSFEFNCIKSIKLRKEFCMDWFILLDTLNLTYWYWLNIIWQQIQQIF